ncbi:DnaK family protein, partial [Rhizoctonia solani AG-3 Rhs1AP]
MILSKLKETAELYLGVPITHAVITVPAYFNDAQRQATKDAGAIAGLAVLRILNEPTAAAIAYGLDLERTERESRVLVFDLGGGTFDVSLLRINQGVFEVLAVSGDGHLGGQDFDNRVIDYLVSKYKYERQVDVSSDNRAMSKLRREVEKAKRILSSQLTARMEIESFEGGNDYSYRLTRAKFDELNMELFQRTLQLVKQALQDARLESSEVDEVILVGGSTRITKIRELLKDFFGGRAPKMGINPDEAVAYGAAIEGGILGGEQGLESITLIDVCPMTLGVELIGGVFSPLISRNTPLPFRTSEVFSTASNNQRVVVIKIFQGEQALTKDNTLLGTFSLSGIRPAARGVPQIEVRFEIDGDGILKVSASDIESGSAQSITITRDKQALSEREIKRMSKGVEGFNQKDIAQEQRDSARHRLQQLILAAKAKLLGPSSMPEEIHSELNDLFNELDSTQSLQTTISPLGSRLMLASEDRTMVFVDMDGGNVLSVVSFEDQFAIMAAVWYSETNLIVGGCNGNLYYVCINPVLKAGVVTMMPFLSPFSQRIRNLALDTSNSILAVGYGNTVALHASNTVKGKVTWRPIELIQGPAHNRSGLVNSLTFFPARNGSSQLLVAYAEAGWSIWNPCGTVRHINPAVHHNVCRVGRASLSIDRRMIIFSTLDRSVVTYPLNDDGPVLTGKKEYASGDRDTCSIVVPVEITPDGFLLTGTTLGEVSIIEVGDESSQGNSTVIRHADETHLIRVILKTGNKVVIGSSSPNESLVRCYSTNAVTRASSSVKKQEFPACLWLSLWIVLISVDPPGGIPFSEAKRDSDTTDLMKPRLQRHQYWVMFGIQHFFKYVIYQHASWMGWVLKAVYDFFAGLSDVVPEMFEIFGVIIGGWMCNQVKEYREAGVCPKVKY